MTPTSPRPTSVTIVHTPACHFCDDAHAALTELGAQFPLVVECIDAADPRGKALADGYRAPMYPLVLVDGVLFSFGRLPRKKLRKLLIERYGVAVA